MNDLTRDAMYLGISVVLIIGAAWKMYRTGRKFLMEAFHRNEQLADSVNHLLVSSFCLMMAGYLAITARFFQPHQNLGDALSFDFAQFGALLMFLGVTLILHIFVLSRMRGKAQRRPNHGESILS
jgi:predicted membrane channel-forming protein YqfA (hemolysin III family)